MRWLVSKTDVSDAAWMAWLTEPGCTHVAMEATGVYWKPVWNILSDGDFELVLANAQRARQSRIGTVLRDNQDENTQIVAPQKRRSEASD